MLSVVITTIQRPTPCVIGLAHKLTEIDSHLVIAGDTKGPDSFDLTDAGFDDRRLSFLRLQDQLDSSYALAAKLPTKHYCRKNIGYLHAIASGASCVYETDDDNMPLKHWSPRSQWVDEVRFVASDRHTSPSWINVYKYFTSGLIWPRGLPLDQIRESSWTCEHPQGGWSGITSETGAFWSPIQQGLANGAPDVDAAWRLILDAEFCFDPGSSVMLSPGQWCPFNTQSTWWWPDAYPLLYVPSYCSFRMCDIWKSFVAQRCLWALGTGVTFHAAEVVQERNPHDLMRDFEDEIPGYLHNQRLASTLELLELDSGPENTGKNLRACYAALVDQGLFPAKELELVDAWLADVASAVSSGALSG